MENLLKAVLQIQNIIVTNQDKNLFAALDSAKMSLIQSMEQRRETLLKKQAYLSVLALRQEILNKNPLPYRDELIKLNNLLSAELSLESLQLKLHSFTCYHGSNMSGLHVMTAAQETTVGEGVYCTTIEAAKNYARKRAVTRGGAPIVYELQIPSCVVLDLRDNSHLRLVAEKYLSVVKEKINSQNIFSHNDALEILSVIFESAKTGNITQKHIHLFAKQFSDSWTAFLLREGFSGLFCHEGGESFESFVAPSNNHETYLFFNPAELIVTREIIVNED